MRLLLPNSKQLKNNKEPKVRVGLFSPLKI